MDPSYLKVEKTGSELFLARNTASQLFGDRKKWIPAIWSPKMKLTTLWSKKKDGDCYFEPDKSFAVIWRERKVDTCYIFGAPNMYFTTLWSNEREDDCFFKSEKLVHSYLEH